MDSDHSELLCPVCFEVYNSGNNIPRLLSCGHCFCTSCLKQIIPSKSTCPSCNQRIKGNQAESFPINYPLKNLAEKYTKKSNANVNITTGFGECSKHNVPQHLFCKGDEVFVCGMCHLIHHKHCSVSSIKESLTDIQEHYIKKINSEVDSVKKNEKILEVKANIWNSKIDSSNEHTKKLESALPSFQTATTEMRKLSSSLAKLMKDMQRPNTIKYVDNMRRLHTTFIKLKKTNEACLENIPKGSEVAQPSSLTPREVWNRALNLKVYVKIKSEVFSTTLARDKKALNICTFEKVKQQPPPNNSLKFEDLLQIVTGSTKLPRNAFFQLQFEGKPQLHTIIIKTEPDSPRAQNFLNLCIGLKGVSYTGTQLYKVKDKGNPGERIYGGDYLFNNGSGSPAVVEGICGGDMQTVRLKRGQVRGIQPRYLDSLSRFGVVLKDSDDDDCWPSTFGMVERGFDVLDLVAKRGGKKGWIKNVVIAKCGLVLDHPSFR